MSKSTSIAQELKSLWQTWSSDQIGGRGASLNHLGERIFSCFLHMMFMLLAK